MRLTPLVALALLAAGACSGAPRPPVAAPDGTGLNAPITEEELDRSHAPDLLTAVQSLRPHWLSRRHSQTIAGDAGITVYLNDYRVGGIRELRTIPSRNATAVSFLTPAQAQFRFGVGNMHGAIAVSTMEPLP